MQATSALDLANMTLRQLGQLNMLLSANLRQEPEPEQGACPVCTGCGEGQNEGARCLACDGTGEASE